MQTARFHNRPWAIAAILMATGSAFAVAAPTAGAPGERVTAFVYDARTAAFYKSTARRLYESGDKGATWKAVPTPGLGRIEAIATAAGRKPLIYVAGPGLGVWRSDDDGAHWSEKDRGLPRRDVSALAAHATLSQTLYAYAPKRGIYRSQDAGRSWALMDKGPTQGIRALIHSDMPGSMQTGWLFAATPTGVSRIMDCFCLWQNAGKFSGGAYRLAYNPTRPKELVVATRSSLTLSRNGGETWSKLNAPTRKIAGLAFAASGSLYAISRGGKLYRSPDEGAHWIIVHA